MANSVVLSRTSRYRGTSLYASVDGVIQEFGVYKPPVIFENATGSEINHVVTEDQVGFPDAITFRYYGPGMETLWWAICRLNGLIDVERDMYAGQVLQIPPVASAQKYTQG